MKFHMRETERSQTNYLEHETLEIDLQASSIYILYSARLSHFFGCSTRHLKLLSKLTET